MWRYAAVVVTIIIRIISSNTSKKSMEVLRLA